MATLIKIVGAVFLGVMLGLLITIQSLDQAVRRVSAGPWRGSARNVTVESDPYTLAATARSGRLPLGTTEGLTFVAETDSKDSALSGACDYEVIGAIPPARFWTLSLLTREGFPIANPANRYGFTSADALRMVDEPLMFTVSAEAKGGNWLPSGQAKRFVLMLRLYDTGLSTVGTNLDAHMMPQIRRLACR